MILDPAKEKMLDSKSAAKAYNNRGWIFRSTDRKRALADLDKAIQLEPTYVKAYYNRVLTYTDLGDLTKSVSPELIGEGHCYRSASFDCALKPQISVVYLKVHGD